VEDFDAPWLADVARLAAHMRPAWMCGDAGLWHFGRRERGHMLLPPILSAEAASHYAEGIVRLRDQLGYEVFPENPPGQVYVGPWHILEFYAEVIERADTGFLLDCAHLAMYQHLLGHAPYTGLAAFPPPQVLASTWQIFEWVVSRAPNVKAIVFECERNALADVLPGFQRIAAHAAGTALAPKYSPTEKGDHLARLCRRRGEAPSPAAHGRCGRAKQWTPISRAQH
jgi:uncharacterized protein (UPF0276 family)